MKWRNSYQVHIIYFPLYLSAYYIIQVIQIKKKLRWNVSKNIWEKPYV